MKKIAFILFLAFNISQAQGIKIKGSDTVLPLGQKEAEAFNKKSNANVSVTGGGSGVGISSLVDGTTDIAASSRKIKMDEKMRLQEAGKKFKEIAVARDALTVIVHPENKVSQLTREQLEGIFTGKIKNWKEVGGADLKIVVYSRETSSGTYEFFKEIVLKRKNFSSSVLAMPATGAIVQSVSQTKGAIGYVGLAYLDKSTKAIKVSFDQGKTYTESNLQTAKAGTYPIVRPLFFYYLTKDETRVKALVDYILSPVGQTLAEKSGYISAK